MAGVDGLAVGAWLAVIAVMLLTLRDGAGGDIGRRALMALAWPLFLAVGIWRARVIEMSWNEIWMGCLVVYGGVLVVTGLRPALVMTEALSRETRSSQALMRRAHLAQILLLIMILAGAGWIEFA
ncbi:MAG: hypothetical protein ABIP45_09270 [Knoellia sp.]